MIATVVIVNLIKKPIVKKAERLAADCGLDKSIVTKYITVLPVAVAFVLEFLTELVLNKFAVFNIDYAAVATSAVLYACDSHLRKRKKATRSLCGQAQFNRFRCRKNGKGI